MTQRHPFLLTAALLAVFVAAATAHAQESEVPPAWTALFGVRSVSCAGGDLPDEQRRQFRDLLQDHQQRLGELGRQLYARQLEYDALSDAAADKRQLDQLQNEMAGLRRTMLKEDAKFARTTKKRFGLDISSGAHCAVSADLSTTK